MKAAAVATAQETIVAAASVASAVAAAAAQVAMAESAVDFTLETEVATAAHELRDLTAVTAHRAAAETKARAVGAAIAACQAAAAVASESRRTPS